MTSIYIQYNGSTVTTAVHFSITQIIDGINTLSFTVPLSEEATWLSRMDQDIFIYAPTGELLGTGYISTQIKNNDSITITCTGQLGKLNWWMVPEGASKFWYEKGNVRIATGSSIRCYDENNNETIAFSNDQYNNEYVIISEGTLSDQTAACKHETSGVEDDYIGSSELKVNVDSETGDYTKVKKTNTADYKEVIFNQAVSQLCKYLINLNIINLSIPITSRLIGIKIEAGGSHTAASQGTNRNFWFDLVGVNGLTGSPVFIYETPVIHGSDSLVETPWACVVEINNVNDVEKIFNKGSTLWSDGYIGIYYYEPSLFTHTYRVRLSMLKVTLTYRTATFDEVNEVIYNTVNPDTISVNGTTNLETLGVSPGDKWVTCKSLNSAFESLTAGAVVSVPYEINKGNNFNKGYSSEYYGLNALTLAQNMCETADARYFEDTSSGSSIIEFLEEQYCEIVATPITGFKPIQSLETENNLYGSISIATASGIVNVLVAGSTNVKQYCETRDDILTSAGGYNYAQKLALKYASYRRSIKLEWDSFQLIRVGYKYTFTVNGTTYSDQICRKVEWNTDGAFGKISTIAYFGGGNTPSEEKIGREIGLQGRRLNRKDALKFTSTDSPITRHNSLQGVYGSSEGFHLSAAQYATGTHTQNTDTGTTSSGFTVNDIAVVGGSTIAGTEYAAFGHKDHVTVTPAVIQTNAGATAINSATGQNTYIGSSAKVQLGADSDIELDSATKVNIDAGTDFEADGAAKVTVTAGTGTATLASTSGDVIIRGDDILLKHGSTEIVQVNNSGLRVVNVADGTAPIIVSSTTVCTNLNAARLADANLEHNVISDDNTKIPDSKTVLAALAGKANYPNNHNLADLTEHSYNSLTDKPTIPSQYTDALAQAACIETTTITEDLTTKSPSSQLVFDGLAAKQTTANLETSALDTSTTKYPCNNLVKAVKTTADGAAALQHGVNDANTSCVAKTGNETIAGVKTFSDGIGSSIATTQTANDNSTKVATTAYVDGKKAFLPPPILLFRLGSNLNVSHNNVLLDGLDGSSTQYVKYQFCVQSAATWTLYAQYWWGVTQSTNVTMKKTVIKLTEGTATQTSIHSLADWTIPSGTQFVLASSSVFSTALIVGDIVYVYLYRNSTAGYDFHIVGLKWVAS